MWELKGGKNTSVAAHVLKEATSVGLNVARAAPRFRVCEILISDIKGGE